MDNNNFDADFNAIRGALRAVALAKTEGHPQKVAEVQMALDHFIDPALHVLQRLVTALEEIAHHTGSVR